MCKIVVIANQKGGVSKTTVCQHLAYALTERDLRVLCVDFDPQANLTLSMLPEGVLEFQIDPFYFIEELGDSGKIFWSGICLPSPTRRCWQR